MTARSGYMPTTIAGKVEMISNLAHKLPLVAESLGIAPDEVQGVQEDSAYLSFALTAKNLHMLKAEEWVTHALLAQNGSGVNPMPKAIQLGPAPKVVPAGALNRVSDMVVRMKRHGNYTEAIGRDLGVVGPEKRVDLGEIRPTLDVRLESGRPLLTWSKGPAQSTEIHVDHGTGVFVLVNICVKPKLVDTSPLPAAGTHAVWRYKAIHRRRDAVVGQWSDIVSIGVIGA